MKGFRAISFLCRSDIKPDGQKYFPGAFASLQRLRINRDECHEEAQHTQIAKLCLVT